MKGSGWLRSEVAFGLGSFSCPAILMKRGGCNIGGYGRWVIRFIKGGVTFVP